MTLYTIRWKQPYSNWYLAEPKIQDLSQARQVLQRIMSL